jgi:hypothetical protein
VSRSVSRSRRVSSSQPVSENPESVDAEYPVYAWVRWLRRLYARYLRWLAAARKTRRIRRVRRRLPIYSQKAEAKRKAHAYANEVVGRRLTWKAARKKLSAWDRAGRTQAAQAAEAAQTKQRQAVSQ